MLLEIKDSFKLILNKPRSVKTIIALSIDITSCIVSFWIAYYLRLGEFLPLSQKGGNAILVSLMISLPIFIFFGLYKAIFRYSGSAAIVIVLKAILIYGFIYSSIITIFGIPGIPRTIGIIQPLIYFLLISSWRLLTRYLIGGIYTKHWKKSNLSTALVYGTGKSGRQLVRAMQDSLEIYILGFLDDDINQHDCFIDGKRIYSPSKLNKLIIEKNINLILLALPEISRKERNKIIQRLRIHKIAIRTIPTISDYAKGKTSIKDFEELDIDDLLGRTQVEPFESLMKKNIYKKTILVTGAGGSIGSQLCREIIKLKPKKLLLLEINEYALYSINSELENLNKKNNVELIPLIGSIQEYSRVNDIIQTWKPATIYHAAAYKHVPLVEHNLIEGLKNNVFGTLKIAEIAMDHNVSDFVFISTDKAVRPTNIMGASKRLGELILQSLNDSYEKNSKKIIDTKFSIVRFGNVLGSSGSVIPKFRSQIKEGGPITLTHREITRYFMSLKEASQLVIQAGALSDGGDVLILDMGEPIKIYDLAKKMIELSGLSVKNAFNPTGDIEIKVTGLRPGEKLYEELLLSKKPSKTIHPKIYKSKEPFIKLSDLKKELEILRTLVNENNLKKIYKKLPEIINEYSPKEPILDYTYIEKIDSQSYD